MSINSVVISGNLTRDPELRSTNGGSQILNFSMAVNDRRKNPQSGEWEDVPNFIDVVVFGNRAESLNKFLTKGMKVSVSGRLHQNRWQAKDGTNRSKIEVIASEVELPPRQRGQQREQPSYTAPAPQQPEPELFDSDIPF